MRGRLNYEQSSLRIYKRVQEAIDFRAPGSGFDPNTLFFAAGINDENDGSFGSIQAVPTLGMVGLVLVVGGLARVRRRGKTN